MNSLILVFALAVCCNSVSVEDPQETYSEVLGSATDIRMDEVEVNNQPIEEKFGPSSDGGFGALAEAYYDNLKKIYYFEKNQHGLSKENKEALKKLANFAIKFPKFRIKIDGHADENGKRKNNIALAQRRANEVERYIVLMGAKNSMKLMSFGEERPYYWGHEEEQWSKNRRVEISIGN